MFLEIDGLGRSFGAHRALRGVSLTVERGEIVSVIGPSGAGKTTLLKIIAGLERADEGKVRFDEPPSKRRPVILVFHDFVLFPNMTVYDNAAFGLAARKMPQRDIEPRVMELLEYFDLADRRNAYPEQLSAGQKQRVAIARAMVVDPMLLLLDEPFANLDRGLKMSTAEFIRETQKRFGITTLAVTHDLDEAFVMSDRVGLMLDGRLVQCAAPEELYDNPVSAEAARFLGPVNELGPELAARLGMHGMHGMVGMVGMNDHSALLRPERLVLTLDDNGPATVQETVFSGNHTTYRLTLDGARLVALGSFPGVRAGSRVRLSVLPMRTK